MFFFFVVFLSPPLLDGAAVCSSVADNAFILLDLALFIEPMPSTDINFDGPVFRVGQI